MTQQASIANAVQFAQFQNSPDEEDAITSLVLQLIRRHPQAAPREEAVRRQVQAFRESVATLLKDRKKEVSQPQARVDETSVAKFFEEIKVLVRDVPERVTSELGANPRMRNMRRRRRLNPMMFEELFHHPAFEAIDNQGLPVLMMFSMLRDDFPWLYELGTQLYRAIEADNPTAIERARRAIMSTAEMMMHGPFPHEMMGPDDEEAMMAVHHLFRGIDRFLPSPTARRKPTSKPEEKKP
jgi:hypothetical protein